MFCNRCNIEFSEALRYCKWCGQPLSDSSRATGELQTCQTCGDAVRTTWSFCKKCGARLGAAPEQLAVTECPQCNAIIDASLGHCTSCGAVHSSGLVGSDTQLLEDTGGCQACGEIIEPGSVYCKGCGRRLRQSGPDQGATRVTAAIDDTTAALVLAPPDDGVSVDAGPILFEPAQSPELPEEAPVKQESPAAAPAPVEPDPPLHTSTLGRARVTGLMEAPVFDVEEPPPMIIEIDEPGPKQQETIPRLTESPAKIEMPAQERPADPPMAAQPPAFEAPISEQPVFELPKFEPPKFEQAPHEPSFEDPGWRESVLKEPRRARPDIDEQRESSFFVKDAQGDPLPVQPDPSLLPKPFATGEERPSFFLVEEPGGGGSNPDTPPGAAVLPPTGEFVLPDDLAAKPVTPEAPPQVTQPAHPESRRADPRATDEERSSELKKWDSRVRSLSGGQAPPAAPSPPAAVQHQHQPRVNRDFAPAAQSIPRTGRRSNVGIYIAAGAMVLFVVGALIVWRVALQDVATPQRQEPANRGQAAPVTTPTPVATATHGPPDGMVLIEGGAYYIGRDDGDQYSRPRRAVTLSPFYIDRTEVTNAQYAKFIEMTGHTPPEGWIDGKYPSRTDNWPVVYVGWRDAVDYAKWMGKRLPTETEWEAAARGKDGRLYPWGTDSRTDFANVATTTIMDAGSFPVGATPSGALDMIGNVWEWTSDEFQLYPGNTSPMPDNLKPGLIYRVLRGSAYDGIHDASYRAYQDGDKGYPKIGFRCVKNADE